MSALACMGGWCNQRETCPRYLTNSNRTAERLCEPGRDGVLKVTAPKPAEQVENTTEMELTMATMLQLMALVRAAAPGGVSVKQVADALETDYRAAASLVSHAHGGRSKTLKLHHRRAGNCGLYFEDEALADAFDMKEYAAAIFATPTPTRAPMQARIHEFVTAQSRGATQEQIRKHIGCAMDLSTVVISRMVKNGRLIAIGPNCWKRYFTSSETVAAIGADVLAEIERTRADNRADTRTKKNEAKRKKWAASAAQRPPKPVKQPKRPVTRDPTEQWRKFMIEPRYGKKKASPEQARREIPGVALLAPQAPNKAPVKIKRRNDAHIEPFIPPHVKVQECPGYRGDVRFMLDRVDGEFASMGIGRYLSEP